MKALISIFSAASLVLLLPLQATQPSSSALNAGASYHFAMAKLLSLEGSLVEALAAFEEAEKLAPDAAYVRLEHAQLLARLSQYSRNPDARDNYLRKAAQQVSEARRLAPENPDVLRAVGAIYLDLSSQDPTALTTAQEALEAVRQHAPADVESLLTLGRLYLDQKEPDKAAKVLRDLIVQVPQQRIAYALLVEALLRAERPRDAEAALEEILGFDPGSLETRLTLADLQSKRGDYRAAIQTLTILAPEEVRQEPRLRRQLAWALYLNGNLDEALKTVDSLLGDEDGAEGGQNQGISLLKGMILTAEGRNTEALAQLEKVRQTQPLDLALAQTTARVLQREGRHEEAARVLSELVEGLAADPEKAAQVAEARLELAQVWFTARQWDKVGTALEPLLSGEETEARLPALLLRTDALAQAGKYDEALALLETGRRSPVIDGKRAEILLRAGRDEEGRRILAELTTAGDPAATVTAVQALHRAEKYEESIPTLEKLAATHADLPVPGFLLAAAYERTGKKDKAVAELRRVLEIAPDFHPALNYLGYTLAEGKQSLGEALELTRRAVALDPDNGAYVDSLGWVYYQLGRHEQARQLLERAARLEPEDSTLQEHLGDVYVALGQKERAKEAYRRALKLEGDNVEQVRRKLDGLGDKPTG